MLRRNHHYNFIIATVVIQSCLDIDKGIEFIDKLIHLDARIRQLLPLASALSQALAGTTKPAPQDPPPPRSGRLAFSYTVCRPNNILV